MRPQTAGIMYDVGRTVPVQCVTDDKLRDLSIKDSCFLLTFIREGSASFRVGDVSFEAMAPCFVCFDERESPSVIRHRGMKCSSVYFEPTFLNVNMTFSTVHSGDYELLAHAHDLFLLKPFCDGDRFVFPVVEEYLGQVEELFSSLADELSEQHDWYWSCRSRSYFMELMLILERIYSLSGRAAAYSHSLAVRSTHLKKAVICIESNYRSHLTLGDICRSASINHSTLTQLFKEELGVTPVEYLWQYRVCVAKKHLAFTELPLKDIALRCGFKTAQHFTRRFENATGFSPAEFRKAAVKKRKEIASADT